MRFWKKPVVSVFENEGLLQARVTESIQNHSLECPLSSKKGMCSRLYPNS